MLPLCGELNTSGPCQSAGSRISNGGSSSSWMSVIAGEVHLRLRPPVAMAESIAVIGSRSYPVYDLLRVPLSMSSGFMPSVIVGASAGEVSPQRRWREQSSPHFYPTAGLLSIEQ